MAFKAQVTYKYPTDQLCERCQAFYVKERVSTSTWKFTCTCCKAVTYRYEHVEDKPRIALIPVEDREPSVKFVTPASGVHHGPKRP